MSVKLTLSSIRWDREMIRELEELQQTNREKLMPKGVRYDKSVVQTSGGEDLMDRIIAENLVLDKEIQKYKLDLIRQEEKALRMIRSLEDSRERLVLQLYYISPSPLTFEQIGERMIYQERQIRRFHNRALEKLEAAQRQRCPNMSD